LDTNLARGETEIAIAKKSQLATEPEIAIGNWPLAISYQPGKSSAAD
jgi:hypothetical protein